MISNPASFLINGNNEKKFTYVGGNKVYHFSPYDNGLSKYLDCNIILFADSEQHGLEILKNMFQFAIDCKKKYLSRNHKGAHAEEFDERADNDIKEFALYRDAIVEGKVKLSFAPTNQVYKVGWASNDNL